MALGDTLLQPENFGKYFHSLFENNFDAKRRHGISWKKGKNSKKNKNKCSSKSKVIYKSLDGTILDTIASCAPDVELPTNASQFAVYFAVRGAILERWMRQAAAVFVSSSSAAPNSDLPIDLDSDTEDISQSRDCTPAKVPKIVGLGLCSVFELIRESRNTHPLLCTKALHALLDVIQGQQPESLKTEPLDVMDSLFELLLDLATSHGPGPSVSDDGSHLTAIACACLLGLVVVRGDTGKLLLALSALLMCPRALANQCIRMPAVLVNLQRSVHTILLGKPTRPDFLTHGIPSNSMTDSFSVCMNYGGKVHESMSVKALASDGKYLYMLTTKGLVKIGTGYGGSLKGHMYRFNKDINYKAWIGYCNNTLYYKQIGLSSLCEINRETLQLIGSADQYSSAKDPSRNSSVMFSDGENLGMITAAKDDSFIVRTLNSSTPLDLPLKLARKCLEVIGGTNDGDGFNSANSGAQPRTILNLPGDEDIAQVASGKDFTLVRGSNGKVYFSGKASVLGTKPPVRGSSTRLQELIIPKNPRIIWLAVGHDGLHAILVADDGSAYFTGTSRRGEDGDQIKVRRQPRASKPKKITKVESHHIVQAACNNGTTALLTRTGNLLMFGKDTVHCDQTTGLVKVLRDEFIISVGLGKAHAVALTATGSVFTFGINNKGQCGREYSPPQKEAGTSFNPAPTAMETSSQNLEEEMETEGSILDLNIPQSASPELVDANSDLRHFAVNVGSSSGNNLSVPNVCNMGDHSFRHDMCMVCTACNECTGYSTSCLSSRPERKPGTECGCGVGDSGCKKCGICRVCALENPSSMDLDMTLNGLSDDSEQPIVPRRKNISGTKSFEDGVKHPNKKSQPSPRNMIRFKRNMKWPIEEQNAGSDVDRDATRVSLLPPARLKLPDKADSTVTQVACGLHHTVLLTEHGNVYTFGSNQYGQLGVGDLQARSGPQRVKINVPIVQIAAGSNHSILLSVKGEVYCFGNYQKGQLGVNVDQLNMSNAQNKTGKISFVHCSPLMVSHLGPQKARRATWVSASGDQTFYKIDESLINATSLVNSIVVANKNSIILFPKYSTNTFKCLVINKRDGSCISNFAFAQADLSNQVICLDPIFGVLWTYTANGKVNCYNIISSEAKSNTESNKDTVTEENKENCPQMANMKNSVHEVMTETKSNKIVNEGNGFRNKGLRSIFNSELSLPVVSNCFVSRSQAAINILCCLDTLNLAQDQKLTVKEELIPVTSGPGVSAKVLSADDYQTVNRFDSHGGGWGYSGHAIEAIRFMCDTDVIIGGFGLFGGRGEYTGKIRLLDLGIEGGEQEGDGELLAETEEAPYDCAPRLKHPALFEEPVHIQANRWYVAWARVSGPSSDCGASGQHLVITEDQIQFSFKSSKKSNNGTDVNAGQIPLIYYKVISNEVHAPPRQNNILGSEPSVHILSKDFSRNVTKDVFQALISLLQWSWSTFKIGLLDIFSQTNIQNQLIVIQELEKLVYISKANLRLLRTYINDIYPSQVSKKVAQESLSLAECIGDVRALLMQILSDGLPDLTKKSTGKAKTKSLGYQHNKKFYNMADTILEECHKTFVSCYHAFYPTANLKWQCLCDLLVEMDKEHQNCHSTARLLSAVLAALCSPSVRLRSTLPVLSAKGLGEPCHKSKLSPSDNAGLPMVSGIDGHHYPILVEQMSYRSHLEKNDFVGWQFKDVLDRLLDIVTAPVKQSINGLVKHRKTSLENTCNNSVLIENKQPKMKPIIPVHCTPDSVIAQQITSLQKRRNYIENIGMSNNSNETNNSNCNDVCPPPPPKTLHLEDRMKTESSHQTSMYSPSKSFNHESIVQVTGLVMNCCHLLARVVAELAYQCTGSDEDLLNACGRTLHCTPTRFSRSNQARTWNTGNGSPDAICFCVDRPGLSIVGAVIYGGSGCYDYELEILDYESESPTISSNKTHIAHRWNSLQMVEGTIGPEDYSKKDMAEIHFEKAVPVKENKKYAIRLRNHGGRTNNGDGGQSSVQGPCGATFHFSTCSLSFNGTTQTRGQIPSLLYYSNPLDSENLQTSRAVLEQQARKSTMDMVTTIAHCCRFLLVQARDQIGSIDSSGDSSPPDVDVIDLCKNLGESSIVNTLMPLVFAHVVPLLSDARSSVQVLTLIQELLPHVSALNQVCSDTNSKQNDPQTQQNSTPNTHYAWVESDHPYKQASVTTYRVIFPANVKWMTLEFDLKCGTVQPEDTLELFIPRSLEKDGKSSGLGKSKSSDEDVSVSVTEGCVQDTSSSAYWPVLHKMSNIPSQWPTSGVILPGREVIFSMETASNYLKDERTNNFGFKCLVVGYEMPHSTNGLQLLENELAHLGGMCAASLIRRDLVLPSVLEDESELENSEEVSLIARLLHGSLLSRGLALSQTPTIQQALDGTLPISGHLHGRQFLRDFVSCAPGSSGGRLAAWLQPESRLCPGRCEILQPGPNDDALHQGWPARLTVVTRDQYGERVQVPDLKIVVSAIPVDPTCSTSSSGSSSDPTRKLRRVSQSTDRQTYGGQPVPSLSTPYEPTTRDKMCFKSITIMKAYNNYSFEELRLASPALRRNSESLQVQARGDGIYIAHWTPGGVGCYALNVTIDGYAIEEPTLVSVQSPPCGVAPPSQQRSCSLAPPAAPPARLRRFVARPSAGLRVRAHPSLQSEQLGIVMVDGTIAFIDEIHNDDGVWLRLSMDTIRELCGPGVHEAWCLQYNQHLGRTLLLPVEQPKSVIDIRETIDRKAPEIAAQKISRKPLHRYFITKNRGIFHPQRVMRAPSSTASSDMTVHEGEEVLIREYVVNEEGAWGRLGCIFGKHLALDKESAWIVSHAKVVLDDNGLVHATTRNKPNQESGNGGKRAYDFSQSTGEGSGNKFKFSPAPVATASAKVKQNTPEVHEETNPFIFGDQPKQHETSTPPRPIKKIVIVKQDNQKSRKEPKASGSKICEPASLLNVSNVSPANSLSGSASSQKSVASSNSSICSVANMGSAINSVVGSSGHKFQALQKWFKGEETKDKSSEGRGDKKRSDSDRVESSGISVRDLVRAIGDSRSNGNAATPPDTPKREHSPRALSSSPVTIPASRGIDKEQGSSPHCTSSPRSIAISPLVSGAALERRGSTLSDTSALVSSLTRDLSQSPSQSVTTPANVRDLSPAPSPSPTNSGNTKSEDILDSPRKLAQAGTQTSPENTDASANTAIRSHFSLGSSCMEEGDGPMSPKLSRRDHNRTAQLLPKSRVKRSISPGLCVTSQMASPSGSNIQTAPTQNLEIPLEIKEPIKEALAPSVAESLRAMFAAFLWHEGIVHDAMACASFLKFHPSLPKEGALVVTRSPHNVSADGHIVNHRTAELTKEERARQRHSVEVTTAGNYLQIQPSTLETLTRSAANANANRNRQRKSNADVIKEEVIEGSSHKLSSLPEVVSVLPPALKSLVLLWEQLSKACLVEFKENDSPSFCRPSLPSPISKPTPSPKEMSKEAKDKGNRSNERAKLGKEMKTVGKSPKMRRFTYKKNSQNGSGSEQLSPQESRKAREWPPFRCELCPAGAPPNADAGGGPVTHHMRREHPGCGGHADGRGYNSAGFYCQGWAGNCGEGGQDGSSWYLLCDQCREKYLTAAASDVLNPYYARANARAALANNASPTKNKKLLGKHVMSPVTYSGLELHEIIKHNAMFLLDLASAANTGISNNQRRLSQPSLPSVSEKTTPPDQSGPWAPLPPFQCLASLGEAQEHQENSFYEEEIKRQNLADNNGQRPLSDAIPSDNEQSDCSQNLRFHRSVSMGQGGGGGPETAPFCQTGNQAMDGRVILMRKRNYSGGGGEVNNDAGSSLLCYPSPNLQKLVPDNSAIVSEADETSNDECLLNRPTMTFLFQNHDLTLLKLAMKQAIRKATCRIYALQAMNWLLRSVTQASCLHDLLWWFVYSLNPSNPEQDALDDACENRLDDLESRLCEHPVSDLVFSGDLCSPLASSLHAFLQSVADLTLALPSGSPLQMMAVRCWGIQFMQSDHAFLHRSHVFGNISKILSRSEEEACDDVVNSLCESNLSTNPNYQVLVESLQDITSSTEIKASSRQAMTGSLVDSSTETFWESGEEDRGKSKHIDVTCPGGTMPSVIYVHVDNSRDIGNKVSSISFMNGVSFSELNLIKTVDVESRSGTWLVCFLPEKSYTCIRVDVVGPDNSLRIRQIRVLGAVYGKPRKLHKQHSAASVQHRNCEAETLKVFRLITSQVFGKLILGESVPENINCSGDRELDVESSTGDSGSLDLREHMVGILFSRSKLTHLQKQVIVHIVQAIRKEAMHARVEWETFLCTPTTEGAALQQQHSSTESLTKSPDTYCFEMLSMVLALSGSSVGRAYLSHQYGLLRDLFSLLHTGSARVQRQVTSLLRRILPDVAPSALCTVISVPRLPVQDYNIITTGKDKPYDMHAAGILDVFLGCVSKALTLQVKGPQSRGAHMVATLSSYVRGGPPDSARWWLAGSMAHKQAEGIIRLLKDMALGKLSEAWAQVTKGAVAEAILNLTRLEDSLRAPQKCLQTPTLWLALAALCILDSDHVERLSSGQWVTSEGPVGAPPRPTCSNHDDGETSAVIQCVHCGNLCADCDRILHLPRRTRMHLRTVCKEEEEAIKVDVHEGCGRTKLFWLLALTDSATLKALVEFREGRNPRGATCTNTGVCRFCGTTGDTGLLAIGNVCADVECQDYGRTACSKLHPCGHICGGIAGEKNCLPCLHGCGQLQIGGSKTDHNDHTYSKPPPIATTPRDAFKNPWEETPSSSQSQQNAAAPRLTQDSDDMCMICFTEALSCAPAIQLSCGHVFHAHCCRNVLSKRWPGPRITFGFSLCPICKCDMDHSFLSDLIKPIRELYADVKRKALMRLEYEGLLDSDALVNPGLRYHGNPTAFAMDRYAYYVCYKCNKAYYGGEARCDAEVGENYDPQELVCGGCSDVARAQMCPKHGADFLEYKCRYCCSVAVFFCFGTTHFCNPCHEDFQRVTNIPRLELPLCPAGPKALQLDGDECPLHIKHPPTGEEFALGCGVCRNAHTF